MTVSAAPTESLGARILRETARFAVWQALAAVVAFGVNFVLGRVLDQNDYGVYDICSFFVTIGSVLGDGGLGASLLRRKGEVSREEYRVAMTTLVGVATAMCCLLAAAAPWLARHWNLAPSEAWVIRAVAPLYVLNALRSVPYIRLERDLQFARIARIEVASSLVRHGLAIALALSGARFWALVVGSLAGTAVQLALAYRAAPGWVGLGWSWRVLRPLVGYGGRVQALAICAYLKDYLAPALLGPALGTGAVGLFDFGKNYIQMPVVMVNSLARVQLPVYARLRRDDPTLFDALRGALRASALLGIPALVALAVASPWTIARLYSPHWLPATPVVWGLLANMVGGLAASPLFTLLQGQGRAGLAVKVFVGWTAVTWALAIAALTIAPGHLGAVAAAHSVVTVIVVAGLFAWAKRHLRRNVVRGVVPPAIAGAVALLVGLLAAARGPSAIAHPLVAALLALGTYATVLLSIEGRALVADLRLLFGPRRSAEVPATADAAPAMRDAA